MGFVPRSLPSSISLIMRLTTLLPILSTQCCRELMLSFKLALSLYSDAGRILRLDPRRVRPRSIGALDALRHDALVCAPVPAINKDLNDLPLLRYGLFPGTDVSCGSNATEPFGAGADQCLLLPASDQIADKSRMTKRANLRHHGRYSITSSASANSLSGIVRPSDLAVLRLTTSSYLVGA